MLYASDFARLPREDDLAREDAPDELPNLVAEILAHAVEKRQRRQLSLGYRRRHAVISRVRGRIDILTTMRRQLLSRGRVACRFDELTIDTPRNRFVRAALEKIARLATEATIAHRYRRLAYALFTSILTGGWYRDESLRSGYLFQIYTYLRSQAGRGDPIADRAEGLLLHPSVGEMVDETAVIQGHAIRFATVDLAAPSLTIRQQLLKVVESPHFT